MKTAEEVAKAEREKQVTLVIASQEAERQAIGVKVSALAEKEASEAKAEAIRTLAKANRENYEAEAAGKRALNEAINMLSNRADLAAGEARADPGAAAHHRAGGQADAEHRLDPHHAGRRAQHRRCRRAGRRRNARCASGNLAEQAVGAALKYRAYAPVVDQLIKEVGLSGDGLGGLVKVAPQAPAPGERAGRHPVKVSRQI